MAAPGKYEAISYNDERVIMIVDDDVTLLKFFKIHLNKYFTTVLVVDSAAEAMSKLKEIKGIDLILSDFRMPKANGIELLEKVRKKDPSIPFLVISGAVGDPSDQAIIERDAEGFLAKPFSIEQLEDFLKAGLEIRDSYKMLLQELGGNLKKFKALRDSGFDAKKVTNLKVPAEVWGRIQKKAS